MTNPVALNSTTSLTRPAREMPQPKSAKKYTGAHPPTVWEPDFRSYGPDSGLTLADFEAFKAMPENLTQVAQQRRHNAVRGTLFQMRDSLTPDMTLVQVQAAFDTAKTAVAAPFATEQSVLANIGKTVKTQDDVVRAFNPPKT